MYMCVYARMCVRVCDACAYMRVCVHVSYVCMFANVCVCVRVCVCMCAFSNITIHLVRVVHGQLS